MCFSLSYYKILNVLSTEVVHVWKRLRGKLEFPASSFPEKCSVGGEGGRQEQKKNSHGGKANWGEGAWGKKITVRMDPSPSLLGSSVNDFECFSLIDRSLGQSTNVVHLKLVQCK